MLARMHGRPPAKRSILLLLLAFSLGGRAYAQPADETERWVPSIGVVSGVFAQKANASTDSTGLSYLFTVRTAPNPFTEVVTVTQQTNANLRPPTDGDDVLVTPFVGGTLEL